MVIKDFVWAAVVIGLVVGAAVTLAWLGVRKENKRKARIKSLKWTPYKN